MVSPGSLRQSVAEALGLSDQLERVDVHLRNLREARLITKAKTGRGAAEMGLGDATNLLIAIAASELVKDSVESVKQYGALKADPNSVSIHGRATVNFGLPLLDLPEGHSFLEAANRILHLLGSDEFFAGSRQHLGEWRRIPDEAEYLFVRFFLSYKAVSIVYGCKRRFQIQLLYGTLPVKDTRAAWDLRSLQTDGRLLTVRIVDKVALMKIAKAIHKE
jgi:hypothetical protein